MCVAIWTMDFQRLKQHPTHTEKSVEVKALDNGFRFLNTQYWRNENVTMNLPHVCISK